ncbi:MAG: HAD hydrolase-like protein [Christensenellaceae bacterium]|jgi:phosphoglycolate phosphatase-like HAD superfamily hydrolase/uridine kinase|nr:HAD hydrolase-like protein [Christensenellaceae bacterium]
MTIFFDLDGTLFETGPCVVSAARGLFAEYGLPSLAEPEILSGLGKPSLEFLRGLLPKGVAPEGVRGRFRELERATIQSQGRLFPGAREELQRLYERGDSLHICSNASPEYLQTVLKATKIEEFFAGVHSASEYASKGALLQSLLRPGEEALLIGDTRFDLEAAASCNLPFIAARYGYGSPEELAPACFFADCAEEISGCVEQARVFYAIASEIERKGAAIAGINGVDCSGKTSFAQKLARYLRARGQETLLVHGDDFHKPAAARSQGKNEVESYLQNAFDQKRLAREVLLPFKTEGCLHKELLCLDLSTDRFEKRVELIAGKGSVLLVEGVLLFREPLLPYFELKIFLKIGFDETLRRAALRDAPTMGEGILEKYRRRYIPAQMRYLSESAPENSADFVVDNEDFARPAILRGLRP